MLQQNQQKPSPTTDKTTPLTEFLFTLVPKLDSFAL